MAHDVAHGYVGTVAFDGDAVLLLLLAEMQGRKEGGSLPSPHVTVQFEIVTSFEFHVSVPSVFTVDHWEFEIELISRFVIVTFAECATNVCLFEPVNPYLSCFPRDYLCSPKLRLSP